VEIEVLEVELETASSEIGYGGDLSKQLCEAFPLEPIVGVQLYTDQARYFKYLR
jgi:hypothetical protein